MQHRILIGIFCLCFPLESLAQGGGCGQTACPEPYRLISTSETRSYGVLIAAPLSGCRKVRFRVEAAEGGFLGHTPALAPGELAIVRVGRGFGAGEHLLAIASEGCAAPPAATRRVTFAKRSPDHGWRAAN